MKQRYGIFFCGILAAFILFPAIVNLGIATPDSPLKKAAAPDNYAVITIQAPSFSASSVPKRPMGSSIQKTREMRVVTEYRIETRRRLVRL